jgi:hypothetical protein
MLGIASSMPCFSQSVNGTFVGRVSDKTGAIVPDATVVLTAVSTNIVRKQSVSKEGEYSFSSIEPGVYQLVISSPGFRQSVLNSINLDADQTVREDVALEVGDANASVVVNAVSPLIQTDGFAITTVIDADQIEETPLDGRTGTTGLLGLVGGVQRPNSNPLIAGSSFSGGVNESVDGISINDILNARISDAVPSLDAIAQFVVITNNPPAEYGNGGAQMLITTKSGTNAIHGSIFEFNRNNALTARNYFLLPTAPKPPYLRNEFGATIGGPIKKDKLFFFASFEDSLVASTVTRQFIMPPAEWKTGDFSKFPTVTLNNGAKQASIIYDPLTGAPFNANPNDPNFNHIPASRISPTSQKLLFLYSNPNICQDCLTNNFSYSSPSDQKDPRWSIRLDYQMNPTNHLFFHFYPAHNATSPSDNAGTDKFGNYHLVGNYIKQYAAGYSHVFSARLVNELDLGLYQFQNPRLDQNYNLDAASLVPGLPPAPPGYGQTPTITIGGIQTVNHQQSNMGSNQHSWMAYDNFTYVIGRHTIKFGGQYIYDYEEQTLFNSGSFTFNGTYTTQGATSGQKTSAVTAFADFLLGDIVNDGTYNNSASFAASLTTFAGYVSDTWNATPKLTISYGIRYDKLFPFQMKKGGLSNIDPTTGNLAVVTGTPDPTISHLYPFVMGKDIGVNTSNWIRMQSANFAPRLGFALRPFGGTRFVLRGGYGLAYDNLNIGYMVNSLANQYPFVLNNTFTANSSSVPNLTWDNPFPTTGLAAGNPSLYAVQRNFKTPYNQFWNVAVEAMVTRDTAIRIAYLGNQGTHLLMPVPLNDITPQPIGGAGHPPSIQAARPYQPWGTITYYASGESTNVNQLQLAAVRRFKSITFNVQYQHTKALGIDGPNNELLTDKADPRYDYGNLDYYGQNALTAQYSYDLPVGTGRFFLGHLGKEMNLLVGGWQFTGVVNMHTGAPVSITYSTGNNPTGTLGSRANRVPGPLYPKDQSITHWFNAAAFSDPAPYTFGNSQRNIVYNPGYKDWDSALFKNFQINDRMRFEFRVETFNFLNHPNFAGLGGAATTYSSSAGIQGAITATGGNNRTVQFGGRLRY